MKARILVVEDEPQLRALLRLYPEREGHIVTDAGDGPAALAAFDAAGADLVILDLMLPGMSGETVLDELRADGDVPVLITSAKRSDAERIAPRSVPEPMTTFPSPSTRTSSPRGLRQSCVARGAPTRMDPHPS